MRPADPAEDTERVIRRVRKLLALRDSPNVHEAAAAAEMAQALICKHRLERLLAASEHNPLDRVQHRLLSSSRRLRRWTTVLAAELAAVNDCVSFVRKNPDRTKDLIVVGDPEDLIAFEALWEWLVPVMKWLSASDGGGTGKKWHDDFRVGAATVIARRLRAATDSTRDSLSGPELTALTPKHQAKLSTLHRAATDRWGLRPGRRLSVNLAAFEAGQAAGERLDLTPAPDPD